LVELESGDVYALLALGFAGFTRSKVDCSFETSEVKLILSDCCGISLLFFINLKNDGVKEAATEKAGILGNTLLDSFHHFVDIASEDVGEGMSNS